MRGRLGRSVLAGVISLLVIVATEARVDAAKPGVEPWALGVSVVDGSPLGSRAGPAVVDIGGRVLVFGGGSSGEGVSTRDGHDDGAIFDPTTRRWTRIARAPFKVVGPGGVWTGRQVVMFGVAPTCAVNNGERECRSGVLHAGVYDISGDSWHELRLPAELRKNRSWGATPLVWTGTEAVFAIKLDAYTAVNPATGVFRDVPVPQPVQTSGYRCVGDGRVAVLESPRTPGAPVGLFLLDKRARTWTQVPPPANQSPQLLGLRPACTRQGVVVAGGDLATINRYDFATATWSNVAPPARSDGAPCTPQARTCDRFQWSGHGNVIDFWMTDAARGYRYDTKSGGWSEIAQGPAIQIATDGLLAWPTDQLAALYGNPQNAGHTTNDNLMVYRPG